jgi:hypothetical protein
VRAVTSDLLLGLSQRSYYSYSGLLSVAWTFRSDLIDQRLCHSAKTNAKVVADHVSIAGPRLITLSLETCHI